MAKATPIIGALNAGEWSPLLEGRTDLQGYGASCHKLENFIPLVQGPAERRGGTMHVRAVKDMSDRTWLVPFKRSLTTSYQIEFGDQYCRFYFDRSPVLTGSGSSITGATQANPIVITSASHPYVNGDDVFISGVGGMTEINGRWFKVANKATNTFELTTIYGDNVDGTGYTAYTSGGTIDKPYEIASPYTAANLVNAEGEFNLDYVQSADVLYITDRAGAIAPRKLSRTSATSWSFSTLEPDTGPFEDINATSTTMYVSAATGVGITITASSSVFTADHVGAIVRIDQQIVTSTAPWEASKAYSAGAFVRSNGKEYEAANSATSGTSAPGHTSGTVSDGAVNWIYRSPGYGIARITAQAGTSATADVLTRFPQTLVGSGNASEIWRFGAWSDAAGYPETVTFFRERLCFGQGQRLDMSASADFENFSPDSFGEVLPDSAVSVTMQSSEVNDITALAEGDTLVVFTEGAEFTVDSLTTSEPFGPNNVKVARQSGYGARPGRPSRVGEAVLFIQGSGRKARELTYDIQVDNLVARDMTIRAEHIAYPRLTQMARQEEPYQVNWFVRSDGVLVVFTYDNTQEVRGWARQTIGGSGEVECVSVIPAPDGSRDDVWLIVKRTINGQTARFVEYVTPAFQTGDDLDDATYFDSGLTYDSTAATVIYGLDHLEGETVKILADGTSHPDKAVSAGTVTLDRSASTVQIGFVAPCIYASHRSDAGARDGTSQAKTKRITDVAFRVLNTLGGQAGPSLTVLDDIPDLTYRAPATPMDGGPGVYTGDAFMSWPGGYETDGRIWYYNASGFPATLVAVVPQVHTQEQR